MRPIALFITYTMRNPIVGGAFFRALRLACELERRGWDAVICNRGPMLSDPKIDAAPAAVQIRSLDAELALDFGLEASASTMQRYIEAFDPAVVIMGESPFPVMQTYYDGAQAVAAPFVVFDQYYNRELLREAQDVDLMLLYGLRSFWKEEARLPPPYVMTPPFIEAVTPKADLPVPDALHARPWLLLVAYELPVLRRGIDLLATLTDLDAAFVTISPDPDAARDLLTAAGIEPQRSVALSVQSDAHIFGFMGAARVTLVSNGFLQIMDALAMGSPVIALARGGGVGMQALNINRRFRPYVSFGEDLAAQQARVRRWYATDPFPPALRTALQQERRGTTFCADRIEELVRNPPQPAPEQSPVRDLLERIGRAFGVP